MIIRWGAHIFCAFIALALSACCSSRPNSPCSRSKSNQDVVLPRPDRPILQIRGGSYLEGLHPDLAQRARLLYERTESEGILLRFISGYRRFRKTKSNDSQKSMASWHNFGAAFDVLLHSRKGMKDSLAHLEEDKAQWDRVGEIAKELGLIWGKPWGKEEIFHFEWHPGLPEAIRRPTFQRLIERTGTSVTNYQKAWELFTDSPGEQGDQS